MPATLMHRGLERAADRHGDHDAIRAGDDSWSFRDLDGLSNAFARHLAARGVGAGDRVAVMAANRVELVVVVQAISKVGAAAVLLSPAWKAAEVGHAVALTEPRHAVADGDGMALLAEQLGSDGVLDLDDASALDAALAYSRSRPTSGPERRDTDEAILVFSSGTTGLPKAVRHTHASIGKATAHWYSALGLGPDDRFQVATPPSHILGLLNLLAATEAGATVRLHRRFDLDEVLHRIATERMTLEMAVAPIALAMANHPHLEDYDLSSLRYIMWGATPVTESVAETVTRRTGIRWLPAYGASELPVIAANPVAHPSAWRLDSAGLPPAEVELRVLDLDSGEPLPAGGTGEIVARSPSVMAGYLPGEADAEAFVDLPGSDEPSLATPTATAAGPTTPTRPATGTGPATGRPRRARWYRTGDVGWLEPEGWVHLTDRCKEMIKVSGFQVAPAEVEAVLHGHPAVLDCAVFGVPDERAGEVPVAAVQLDRSRTVTGGELERLVADTLATYKHLHRLVVVDAVPRLPSGKVLRRTLRDSWIDGSLPGAPPPGAPPPGPTGAATAARPLHRAG